uniref:Uncharacterized protein n=1 Tax=Octopus bimaculoides TaxID=37653 RepID=A0A0L8I6D7_OCTBM
MFASCASICMISSLLTLVCTNTCAFKIIYINQIVSVKCYLHALVIQGKTLTKHFC